MTDDLVVNMLHPAPSCAQESEEDEEDEEDDEDAAFESDFDEAGGHGL